MERNELTLDIQNLEKTYKGNVEAVRGIDVKLDKQRIYALLGPNGAGKTTVLKSILGLINYSGSILVLGKPIDEVREMISFVPEEKNLCETLDIEKTLKLNRRISSRFDETQARKYIAHYKLPCTKKIRTFSNGMKTAIYISLALSTDADLYILDEPTWGLDPIMRDDTLEFIREKVILGKTVLYTSHIIPEVEKIADEFFIMINGKVKYSGDLDGVKEKYRIVRMPFDKEQLDNCTDCLAAAKELNRLSIIVENSEAMERFYKTDEATISIPDLEDFFQILVRSENGNSV
ncbi:MULTISPECIES: ABC transporter ATP-binding protein [unclassified Mesotoga]|uniref:ABC transporter ATP-binding protein n=1 Tax=unclassified Mesotoga TaxID=1184398 RepID=UPI000DA65E18|nr:MULTISPECIES: ABC transporter ATP-binding protein [unclassified Mesotoga]PZC53078.1 ABC transporter [Mesotoga sp. TolDC]